jgi:hypothetical protein
MNNLITDIKALQEETLLNLQSSKAINTVELINLILRILGYFVLKMDLNLYLLNQK